MEGFWVPKESFNAYFSESLNGFEVIKKFARKNVDYIKFHEVAKQWEFTVVFRWGHGHVTKFQNRLLTKKHPSQAP